MSNHIDHREIVMVAWVRHHGRSEGMARALGGRAVFMPWAEPRQPVVQKLRGWLRSAWVTVALVTRLPPRSLVIVQAPPVFAPLTAHLVVAVARRDVAMAIDVHSGALNARRWRLSVPLMRWLMKRSDAVIVTNEELIAGIDVEGTPTYVTHDPLARRDTTLPPSPADGNPYVVFPASGSPDEPMEAVVGAARLLGGKAEIVVTGKRSSEWAGRGVRAAGFLPDDEYHQLLEGASAVLALTTREATMQRAGYEAMEAGCPLVCSSTRVLRAAFGEAAVFVEPTAESIAAGIGQALERGPGLRRASLALAEAMQAQTEQALRQLAGTSPRQARRVPLCR